MQSVLEAIRKACLPGVWSQGVKLAREGAVSAAGSTPGELDLPRARSGARDRPDRHALPRGPRVDVRLRRQARSVRARRGGDRRGTAQAAERGESLTAAPATRPPRLTYRLDAKDAPTHDRSASSSTATGARSASPRRWPPSLARGRTPEGWTPTHEDLKVERILAHAARARSCSPDACATCSRPSATTRTMHPRRRPRPRLGRAASRRTRASRTRRGRVPAAPGSRRGDQRAVVARRRAVRRLLHPLGEANTTGERLESPPARAASSRRAELGDARHRRVLPELERMMP